MVVHTFSICERLGAAMAVKAPCSPCTPSRASTWLCFPGLRPGPGHVQRTLALPIGSTVVSLHTPPCLTPPHARFFAPELGLLIHDASGRRFRLEMSAFEGGNHPPNCDGCTLRRCLGVRAEYLARELKSLR